MPKAIDLDTVKPDVPAALEQEKKKSYQGRQWSIKRSLMMGAGSLIKEVALLRFNPKEGQERYKKELFEFSGSHHRFYACDVIARFGKEWVLHALHHPPQKNIYHMHWAASLLRDDRGDLSPFGECIQNFSVSEGRVIHETLKTVLLKGFSNLSAHLRVKEKEEGVLGYDPELFENITLKIFERTASHFSCLKHALEHRKQLDPDLLFAEFGEHLHPSIPADSRLNSVESLLFRRSFFQNLAKDLTKIAFPNGKEDLVLPSLYHTYDLKETLFVALEEKIFPSLLHLLTESVLDAQTIDLLLLKIIERDSTKELSKKETDIEQEVERSLKHKELSYQLESILENIGAVSFSNLSKALFSIPNLKKKIAESVVDILIPKLKQSSLEELINQGIQASLPQWHKGEWKYEKEHLEFVLDEEDSFTFLSSPLEYIDLEKRKNLEGKKLHSKVEKALSKRIHSLFTSDLKQTILAFFDSIDQKISFWVKECFGHYGSLVKDLVSSGLRFVFVDLIARVLSFAFYPITRSLSLVLENYSEKKSREILKLVHLKVHESLLFFILDDLMTVLKIA